MRKVQAGFELLSNIRHTAYAKPGQAQAQHTFRVTAESNNRTTTTTAATQLYGEEQQEAARTHRVEEEQWGTSM